MATEKEKRKADPHAQAMIDVAHGQIEAELRWLERGVADIRAELAEGRHPWVKSLAQHTERVAEKIGLLATLSDLGFDISPKEKKS